MKHPSSKAIFAVADRLQSMVPQAQKEGNLQFEIGYRYSSPTCGTVCCHGGWYAEALQIKDKFGAAALETPWYMEGALQMSRDLGFEDPNRTPMHKDFGVCKWANSHPEIWGNGNGAYMFNGQMGPFAFSAKGRPEGAKTLQDIVDHWREVGERVKALESPVYEDITQTLAIMPIEETSDLIITKTKENVYS